MIKKIINSAIQGLFWLLPIAAIIIIANWLFTQTTFVVDYLFSIFEFDPQQYRIIWTGVGVLIVIIILSIIGALATTRLANSLESLIRKIPLYSTIKDIISIFNSSKKDTGDVLVVAVKGFTQTGYNIGLMYSTKESIIKDHYTITIFLSPLPSSGFMFEIHKDDVFVIENAKFNDNLQYIISMGTRSMAEILKVEPQARLTLLSDYLEQSI
jgi:uncharacterized membrane protein